MLFSKIHNIFLCIAFALFSCGVNSQVQSPSSGPMHNADVIAMVQSGIPDEIVIAKIEAAPSTAFDNDIGGLSALKTAKVSSAVVRAMINPHPAANIAGTPAAATGNPDDPLSSHSPGIYAVSTTADGQTHLTKLQAEHPRGATNNGMFLRGLTHGIVSSKSQEVLDGAAAPVELTAIRPIFYAYIPEYTNSFAGGINVNDLVLTRLDVKGGTRLSTYAAHGLFASNEVGNDQKARQGFASEQVKPGIYKLTLAGDLTPGQYAFKWAMSFFDFGVKPASASAAALAAPVQVVRPRPASPQHPSANVLDLLPAAPGFPPIHATHAADLNCWWSPFVSSTFRIEMAVQHCANQENDPKYGESATGITLQLAHALGNGQPEQIFTVLHKPADQPIEAAIRQQLISKLKSPAARNSCVSKRVSPDGSGIYGPYEEYEISATGPYAKQRRFNHDDETSDSPCPGLSSDDAIGRFLLYSRSLSKTVFFFFEQADYGTLINAGSIRVRDPS